jgi:hypothetical protein
MVAVLSSLITLVVFLKVAFKSSNTFLVASSRSSISSRRDIFLRSLIYVGLAFDTLLSQFEYFSISEFINISNS